MKEVNNMSITLYQYKTDNIYACIRQEKGSNLYHLIIANKYGQTIKQGYYMSMKSAKQALNRFIKKEG